MGFQILTLDYNKVTATLDSNGNDVTATNSSTNGTSNLSELFDGGYDGSNTVDLENSDADFTLEYDFGEDDKQYLGDIQIQFGSNRQATAYTIQASKDGINYTTIHTVTSDPGTDTNIRIYGAGNEPGIQDGTTAVAYRKFKFNFTAFNNSDECRIREMKVYTISLDELSFKDYNVEFDDALLDLEGWKNPRYNGSKLTGAKINQFNQGDTSYGLNPVIENKTACIFLGKDIDEGNSLDKAIPLTEIMNHSYLTIDKILFINTETDDVEIVARENMDERAFNRLVSENFPEGSSAVVKSLEDQKNKLKPRHFVKFNQGQLMKVYSYTANTDGYDDGVFGGHEIYEHKGENKSTVSGSGLFGYGQSAFLSSSLFDTESIQFTTLFPAELSFYEGNYSTETMGSKLVNISASVSSSNQAGSTAQILVTDQYGVTLNQTQTQTNKPSDIRLKENIIYLRKSILGIPIYTFNYIGRKERYIGTMAQDLIKLGRMDAIKLNNNGYYSVYYDKIDVNFNII